MNTVQQGAPRGAEDGGVSLIEIVVSMLIFGLLAVAFLPMLIMAVKSSGENATIATASQLAGQQVELVRAASANCASIQAFNAATASTTDARGNVYQPETIVGACPATFPAVIPVEVKVWDGAIGNPGGPLATASTLVLVTASVAATP